MPEAWFPPGRVRAEGDSVEAEYTLPADAPWFAGHFPGLPMLPGVGMLALAVHALSSALERPLQLTQIKKLRFRGIVRPGETISYKASWSARVDGLEARVEIRRADESIGGGTLLLRAG